jgi:lipopolysaccharide export system permease protein
MKKIHLLVLKNYLGPLVMTFFISLFVLLMQFLWKYIDDLVGKGLEWYIIAELLFYASSTFVPLALPLAILLSSLMTFGNLGEHYELVAMKSAGISLRSIMKPMIILSLAICGFAFYFSNNVLPIANLKFKSLLYDVRKKRLAVNIKDGIFYNGMDDYVIRVGKKSKDGKTIYNVMIYNHTQQRGNIDMTVADSGKMETSPDGRFLIFTLNDGYNYAEKVDQKNSRTLNPFQRTYFKEQIRRFDLSSFELSRTNEDLFKRNYQMLNISQLDQVIDSLSKDYTTRKKTLAANYLRTYRFYSSLDSTKKFTPDTNERFTGAFISNFPKGEQLKIIESAFASARSLKKSSEYYVTEAKNNSEYIIKHMVVWHKKFTLSFACLVLFFIGAPLGAIIRKGGLGLPAVVSVFFFILYHIISIIGEKAAVQGAMEVHFGMWLASAVLLPLGIFLTIKATTDSPLMDMEIWNRFFGRFSPKKLFKKRKRAVESGVL